MPREHHLTVEAAASRDPWTNLWSLDSLRYRGSGWWLDAVLPRSPLLLLAVAVGLPLTWFAACYVLTPDTEALIDTPDVMGQLWFFPLHVLAIRVVGGLWAHGLPAALEGLGMTADRQRRVRRGALGCVASLGALAACAYFIFRDASFGLTANAAGVIPFDDPELWDMAALGRPVHLLMLALWTIEWLMFGYLLWLQLWILFGWVRELRAADLGPHLDRVLVQDGYRHAFTLFGKTTTISLVFALGNLGFIAFTGELIPREVVVIQGVGDFLRELSDLLSTALLFLLTLAAAFTFVRVLRTSLTRSINTQFARAGDTALTELAQPIEPSADLATSVERLRIRANAQADLLRAVAFQREVDVVGSRTLAAMVAKALIPLLTTALKLRKVLGV
ncbi:MAG: hypothetical protein WKG01_31185 [Kofleriaceae bacterium]